MRTILFGWMVWVLCFSCIAVADADYHSAPFVEGDSTVYEYRYGIVPQRLASVPVGMRRTLELESATPSAETDDAMPGKALLVGDGFRIAGDRFLAFDDLVWVSRADGWAVAVAELTIPGAAGWRLAIHPMSLAEDIELRVQGVAPVWQTVHGPFGVERLLRERAAQGVPDEAPYWFPAVEGPSVHLEFAVAPWVARGSVAIELVAVSVLTTSPRGVLEQSLAQVGLSGACQIDISCADSPLSPAVAKYFLTNMQGQTFLCTGTLLNDTAGTGIPWFMTAEHCVDNPADAASMQFFWFFRSTVCGGGASTPLTETGGGAQLLVSDAVHDASFMRLNRIPPTGTRAGWISQTLVNRVLVDGIHHPRGDLQKINFGEVVRIVALEFNPTIPSHYEVIWNAGVTEPGSSGSGIFNDQREMLGVLTGGFSSCQAPSEPDYYGRFDRVFPLLQPWLVNQIPGPGDTVDFQGRVLTGSGVPLCAMVLINGAFMFSCAGDGRYQLQFPLDSAGEATVFAFVDGFAPYRQVIAPDAGNRTLDIVMSPSSGTPPPAVSWISTPLNVGWVGLQGNVTDAGGTPLCAMVLANGQFMFSCQGQGAFDLTVPRAADGSVTLFTFVDGMAPFRITFTP